MQFDIPVRKNPNISKYSKKDMDIARDFATKLYKEFGNFLKAVIIFGSVAKKTTTTKSDLDLLVIVDDIALPFGTLRLKSKGGDGGHNGLFNISQILGHQNYARLRFGIGNIYNYGNQVNYVLGKWSDEEEKELPERISVCHDIIISFAINGIERTMNDFNNK